MVMVALVYSSRVTVSGLHAEGGTLKPIAIFFSPSLFNPGAPPEISQREPAHNRWRTKSEKQTKHYRKAWRASNELGNMAQKKIRQHRHVPGLKQVTWEQPDMAPKPSRLGCPLWAWLVGGRGSPCPCDERHTGQTRCEGVGSTGHCRLLSARVPGFGVRAERPAFLVTVATTSGVGCFRTIQIVPWRYPQLSSENASTSGNIWWLGWETSRLYPKACSEGFAASYTGSCVFNNKHFCVFKTGHILIASHIPKAKWSDPFSDL